MGLFNLTKEDDVCQYVIKRPLPLKEGKKQKFKAPKIQRLVTPVVLQRKRHKAALIRRRLRRTGWLLPNIQRSLPSDRRRPRRPRSSRGRGPPPSVSPSAPSAASRSTAVPCSCAPTTAAASLSSLVEHT